MKILTIAEVAARLGKSKRSIYRLIAAGRSATRKERWRTGGRRGAIRAVDAE